ncbi:hypothetical protein TMU01_30650 [Tenuibacillus multivorans]|uniref:Fructosamine kinase n=2 Tax=Tenuibacillus multivorans TaxID=237069 RepID=A0A1G9ZNP1_9BACI|nr:fructosamine kinase family protein [Tenuibacillus multivorans]GEL78830.1 hypothetical protein TMU01_30650 [Tenuibacillus multivorans]SDN22735.1 Fructosamine kinase [Tenuibacillus multivorans]
MESLVKQALFAANDHTELKQIRPVSGGSINQSYYIETSQNRYFLKSHVNDPCYFLHFEAVCGEVVYRGGKEISQDGLNHFKKTDLIITCST